jgi:exonuclease SbcC
MRLERLEIGGFMNFREPAVLDLREVPPGLVAITGPNGHGKTRLLDAGPGAVYGLFFSRDGNMADYATERDAYVDALFNVEGRGQYRSRINVDGHTGNRDAVLELVQADSTAVPLNDGKVSTHKDAVADVFPPKELLLASAFAAQNRAGSFVSLGKKERKDLFGTLLGLDHYARMCATAKTCLDVVETTRARLAERRDLLARDTDPAIADALQQRANDLQSAGGAAELRRVELQDQLEALAVEREDLSDQSAAHVRALEQIKVHEATIAAKRAEKDLLAQERATATQDATTERTHAEVRCRTDVADIESRWRGVADGYAVTVKDLDDRIAGNQTLNARADAIRAAAVSKTEAEAQIVELRREKDEASDKREQALEQVRARQQKVDMTAAGKLATAREQASLIGRVKFGDQCGGPEPCVLVVNAVTAQASMPALEAAVVQNDALADGIKLWTDQAIAYGDVAKAKAIAIAQVEQRLKALDADAKYVAELAATTARIEGYQQQKTQAATDHAARIADFERERQALDARQTELLAAIERRFEARIAEILVRQMTALEAASQAERALEAAQGDAEQTRPAAVRLVALDREMETGRQAWTANEATLAAVGARRQELDRERQAFVAKVQQRSSVEDRLRQVEDRLLIWQTFTKAFGRDGLPTLEIAAAGPTVSNLTNDLLAACFGTRFTVELVTQEERADGKGLKETLTLEGVRQRARRRRARHR